MKNLKTRLIKSLPKPIINLGKKLRTQKILRSFEKTGKVPFPEVGIIDPSNLCNLNCPLCPTGRKFLKQDQKFMEFGTFKTILSQIPTLKHISLFNWGEPFLNPEIFEMISLAKEKNIFVSLHSNFSFSKEQDFFEKLVLSGADHLEISLDGATSKNYSAYRKKGNFDLVVKNIQALTKNRKKLNKKNPKITWKFIVNSFNENEIEEARKKADNSGVDFVVTDIGLADDLPDCPFPESLIERKNTWLPKNRNYVRKHYLGKYKLPLQNEACGQLFTTTTIGPDGSVYPCCWIIDKKNSFGNILQDNFESIWNGERYRQARELFSKKKSLPRIEKDLICQKCQNFKKYY